MQQTHTAHQIMNKISAPVSIGELLDKISILQIKSQYTNNDYVHKELNELIKIAKKNDVYSKEWVDKLYEVNSILWKIEDDLRKSERDHLFDEDFIHNARLVYITNDKRAKIKKQINENYNSEFQEVKLY